MYILTIEEIFESLNQIIESLETSNEAAYGVVIEIAHQMKDELSAVCAE